jgi:hypothetical protein
MDVMQMLIGEENANRKKIENEKKKQASILEGTKAEAAAEIKRLSVKVDDLNMQALGKSTSAQRKSVVAK